MLQTKMRQRITAKVSGRVVPAFAYNFRLTCRSFEASWYRSAVDFHGTNPYANEAAYGTCLMTESMYTKFMTVLDNSFSKAPAGENRRINTANYDGPEVHEIRTLYCDDLHVLAHMLLLMCFSYKVMVPDPDHMRSKLVFDIDTTWPCELHSGRTMHRLKSGVEEKAMEGSLLCTLFGKMLPKAIVDNAFSLFWCALDTFREQQQKLDIKAVVHDRVLVFCYERDQHPYQLIEEQVTVYEICEALLYCKVRAPRSVTMRQFYRWSVELYPHRWTATISQYHPEEADSVTPVNLKFSANLSVAPSPHGAP